MLSSRQSSAYIRRALNQHGIPEMWIEDAEQDVRFQIWRQGMDSILVIAHASVDAARRYGRTTQRGYVRISSPLSDAAYLTVNGTDTHVRMMDLQRAWVKLDRETRRALAARARGEQRYSRHLVNAGRQRLRDLGAA